MEGGGCGGRRVRREEGQVWREEGEEGGGSGVEEGQVWREEGEEGGGTHVRSLDVWGSAVGGCPCTLGTAVIWRWSSLCTGSCTGQPS